MPFVTKTVQLQVGTGAHTAGDAVGAAFEIQGMARAAGLGGEIRTVLLKEYTTQAVSASLYLYSGQPSAVADDAAYAPTDADNSMALGVIPITAYPATAPGSNQIATVAGAAVAYQCAPGSTSLWGQLQTNGTPTYALNSVWITIVTYYE